MVTIYSTTKTKLGNDSDYITSELRGLSTDDKPTELNGKVINNGSTFIEMDTGKIYMYDLDNVTWREI